MSELFPSTVQFGFPWAILAPLVYYTLVLFTSKQQDAVLFPSKSALEGVPKSFRQVLRFPVLNTLFFIFLLFLSIALMQPREIRNIPQPKKARSIMLSLDISRSMRANDFQYGYQTTTRLAGVKNVVSSFLEERKDDRIGLVVFGSSAFLQSPLTFDHMLLSQIIQQLQVGLAGDGTAIGDGLGIALKRLETIPAEKKAVILMTDGVSNSGRVTPLQAGKVAKQLGITVHTIGIGPEKQAATQLPFGLRGNLLQRERHFDEETLKEISSLTGGSYFHASNVERLSEIYKEIEKLEKTETDTPADVQVIEHFHRPLLVSLLAFLLYSILGLTYFRVLP